LSTYPRPTESRDQPFWTKLEVVMWITGTTIARALEWRAANAMTY
jgi:hypothetical protein